MVAVFSSLPGLLTRLATTRDRKSTRLNSSHDQISYAVFCLKKKKKLSHLSKYEAQIIARAVDQLRRTEDSASGTTFSVETKPVRTAACSFPTDIGFDRGVASALALSAL